MKNRQLMTVLGALIVLALGACSVQVERNPDGSLRIESSMQEEGLQREISAAIGGPLIHDVTADLRDGTIAVSAQRDRPVIGGVDTLTFRLDLGVADGHLTARVSNVVLNGSPTNEDFVNQWNENIANRLERAGKSRPNSTLQSVSVRGDSVTMVWRVETARSRGE